MSKRPHLALALLTCIGLCFLQAMLGLPHRLLSSSSAMNHWLVAAASVSVPFLAVYGSRALPEVWRRTLVWFALLILAVPSFLVAGCAVLVAPSFGSGDEEFQRISEVNSAFVSYRLYRSDCGATCAAGLVLRKEIDLFAGLMLVTPLWSEARVSEGSVSLGESAVRVVRGATVLGEVGR